MEDSADLYADVRVHTATATSKYLHENVVLAAVEEILAAQAIPRSPVAYLGALMTSLEAQGDTDPAVYAGIMTLLERALAHVPRAVLLSKGPRIASALVGVANRHAEHAPVLPSMFNHEPPPGIDVVEPAGILPLRYSCALIPISNALPSGPAPAVK